MDLKLLLRAFGLCLLVALTAIARPPNEYGFVDGALNPAVPLKLCLQNKNGKLLPTNSASDNRISLYIALEAGKIEKLNLEKNSTVWVSDLGGEIVSDVIYDDARVYFVTEVLKSSGGERENQANRYILRALDAETGLTIWQFPFLSSKPASLSSYRDSLFLAETDGTIISIRKINAQKKFEKNLNQQFSSPPFFFENRIYIATVKSLIYALSTSDGEIVMKTAAAQTPASILAVAAGRLFWGDKKGSVYLLNIPRSSVSRQGRYGGEISSLTLTLDEILVTSLDNFVYFNRLRNSKNIWKRRLPGRILGKPLIIGDYVVFIIPAESEAIILNLKSGKIVNQIPLAEKDFFLSEPLVVNNLLTFFTNRGVIAFANTSNLNCLEN